ncbi:4'-phosphopantetheinyl transferase superfamily protein [Hymenobacter tibetensis]|uniref:4'-phosphopantetheinyl transferase superfamily protein n=1 Tax=Hymenobacter tibetensis TaxID=497967 RepID=A0ABY4D1T1_9BACT|nr:4'-phosphopantetheinyl transferase superfamily protein [Hymenobacter tibetensis]UOG76480.1 4'-phosphopantetheinyl transferase superfamily protein [Hymenobacter tibetensis]
MPAVTVLCNTTIPTPSTRFPDKLYSNSVHLFAVETSTHKNLVHHAEHILCESEIAKAGSYHQLEKREQYVISKCALRILLGAYRKQHGQALEFAGGFNSKPMLVGLEPLYFSISYTSGCTLIGIALDSIGVDIEKVDGAFRYQDISETCFSLREQAYIAQSATPSVAFYQLWTRKEALVKATSKGIDDDLQSVPSLNGLHVMQGELLATASNWTTSSVLLSPAYSAAVSYPSSSTARDIIVHTPNDLPPLLFTY